MYKPEYMRRVRAKRREQGLCPGCGAERDKDGRIYCSKCIESGVRRKQESRKRQRDNELEEKSS
ncbi:hypothetical protein [Vallitalea okinawensis]|uniref:hypothetical protein n=1 Tax=Vallitalea okinawensis TaxID=2078660 RepID=UPI000CFB1C38|nr:hypothetical protein [Vallitalea okinawensis]